MWLFQNIDGIVKIHVTRIDASNNIRVCLNGAGPRICNIYDRVKPELRDPVLKQVGDSLGVIRCEGEGLPALLPRSDHFPMVLAFFRIQIHRLHIVWVDGGTYLLHSYGHPRRHRYASNRCQYGRGDGGREGRNEGIYSHGWDHGVAAGLFLFVCVPPPAVCHSAVDGGVLVENVSFLKQWV